MIFVSLTNYFYLSMLHRLQSGSILDSLSYLNQVVVNVGDWDAWPQNKQNVIDNGVYIEHDDDNDNLKDAFESVVVGDEVRMKLQMMGMRL